MSDANLPDAQAIPVRIHFGTEFPIETRCVTSDNEIAIVEILKVEYGLDENAEKYDITFYISGIKSFSISDDDQECFIKWALKEYGSGNVRAEGVLGTGSLEMGERFDEAECSAGGIPEGDYLFEIIYV